MSRMSDSIKAINSYVVMWKGNKPVVQESHWQPGYTPAHCATASEALAHAGVDLIKMVADVREKWLNLQLAGAHLANQTIADAFGQVTIPTPDDDLQAKAWAPHEDE